MKKNEECLIVADVDGVFTNKKAQPNEEAILFSAKIGARYLFAYVTGRSEQWLRESLTPVLEKAYRDYPPRLSLLCAEYGAVRLRFQKGKWQVERDKSPLEKLRLLAARRVKKMKGVFFDDTKQVMISVEARHDLRDTQPKLVEQGLAEAEAYFKELAAADPEKLEYHRTTYACDLTPKGLSKTYGAEQVLACVRFKPKRTELIGDAKSDLLLAKPFQERQWPFMFHFVGEHVDFSTEEWQAYHLQLSNAHYDEGTLEVLKKFAA